MELIDINSNSVEADTEAAIISSKQPFDSEIDIPAPPQHLNEKDIELFRLVKYGSVEEISRLIQSNSNGDYNDKIDNHGNTIWHVAVHRKDDQILSQLLQHTKMNYLYDLLLHAIQEQSISIIKVIIEAIRDRHPEGVFLKNSTLSQLNRWRYSKFSKDITPIILSAQVGNYSLIKYFYDIGEEFQPIYSGKKAPEDTEYSFNVSMNRALLHEYETKASPEMLCYRTHIDPNFDIILEVFQLLIELKRVGEEEHEFYDEYKSIRKKLQNFLNNILDECRSTREMKLLLTQKNGQYSTRDKYPRLMMAIDNNFYKFVTHRHCQKMLFMHWAGESWPAWRAGGNGWKCFQIMKRLLFTPFICLWLYIDFFSDRGRFFRIPVNRWIHHFVSYIYFMGILASEAYLLGLESHANVHNTPCKPLEILIIVFVLGHVVSVIVHIIISPTRYFCIAWHWYDFITTCCFIVTFGFWFTTWHTQYTEPITTPRTHWKYYDSVLCGEAMFAVSIVLAYGRFMRYFQLSYQIGPLQIAMANMIQDISIFVFFFAVIMLSFGMGFYFLYSPFRGVNFAVAGEEHKMADSFTSLPQSLYTLYWGTLSMGPADSADMIMFGENATQRTIIMGSTCVQFTEIVGTALWMSYYLLGPMILMNMLTGYMGITFKRIENNMDATWKYNRSQVWVYYMRNTVLPSPFNLIPTLGQVFKFYTWIVNWRHGPMKEDQKIRNKEQQDIIMYSNLVRVLTQRYIRWKSSAKNDGAHAVTQEEIQNMLARVVKLKSELNVVMME